MPAPSSLGIARPPTVLTVIQINPISRFTQRFLTKVSSLNIIFKGWFLCLPPAPVAKASELSPEVYRYIVIY